MRAHPGRVFGLVGLVLASCQSSALLGGFESSKADGADGSLGGQTSASGGTAGAPALFSWAAHFESADLSEFDTDGGSRFREQGSLDVSTAHARTGDYALLAEISGVSDEALAWLQVPNRSRMGAWYLIEENYQTNYWVILKLGANGTTTFTNVFDIDLASVATGEYCLVLWEHGKDEILRSSATLRTGGWFHLEVVFEASTNGDGILRVLLDGQEVMNTGRRTTIPAADGVTVAFGSVAYAIDPLPAQIWLDDLSVEELSDDER